MTQNQKKVKTLEDIFGPASAQDLRSWAESYLEDPSDWPWREIIDIPTTRKIMKTKITQIKVSPQLRSGLIVTLSDRDGWYILNPGPQLRTCQQAMDDLKPFHGSVSALEDVPCPGPIWCLGKSEGGYPMTYALLDKLERRNLEIIKG